MRSEFIISSQRRLDSSLQRFTRAIWPNHDWEKQSCCRPWDEYSKHSTPQLFRFLPRFPSSIRQEIPLLVFLDPLNQDCIDARIFKESWFWRSIFIVLCSTFEYGCSSWFSFSDSLVIQFEMELFRLSVSRLVSLSQNFEEKTLIFHFVRSSYFPFKVARPSIFVGTPSFFESLILKQIDRYRKNIITHVLHID